MLATAFGAHRDNSSRGEDAAHQKLLPHANLESREIAPNVAPDQKG
jgi:hypothetical protein